MEVNKVEGKGEGDQWMGEGVEYEGKQGKCQISWCFTSLF